MSETVSIPLSTAKRGLLAVTAATVLAAPVALGIVNPARAQTAAHSRVAPALKFSAIRIQRSEEPAPTIVAVEQDAFVVRNATVRDLVRYAYGRALPPQVSGGPGWLDTERYTIQAKLARTVTSDDVVSAPSMPEITRSMPELVRALLEDRFRLRTRVTNGAVYILESAADAPASSQKPVEKGIGLIDQKSGKVTFRGASSASVAEALSTFLSSQVLDHTRAGVTYDFKMKWPRNDLKSLGDQLHERAGLILKSFTMEQLLIEGAEQPRLDADAATSAEQIAAR